MSSTYSDNHSNDFSHVTGINYKIERAYVFALSMMSFGIFIYLWVFAMLCNPMPYALHTSSPDANIYR